MADKGIPPIPNGRGRGERIGNPRPVGRGRATRSIQTSDVVCIGRGRGRGTTGPSANLVHTSSPYLRLRQAMGLGSGPTVDADDKPIKKEDSVKSPTQENSSSTDKQECLNTSRSEDTTKEPSPATCDSTERNANAVTDDEPMNKEDSVKSPTQENSSSTDKQEFLNPSRYEVKDSTERNANADDKPIKKEDSGKSPTQENSSSTDKQECLNTSRSEDTTKEPSPATCDSTERNANAGHSNLSVDAPEFHPAEDVSYLPIMSNLSIDAPEFHPAEDINRHPIMEPDCREIFPSQNVDNVYESPLDDAKAILDFCFGELIATPDVFEDVMLLFQNNFIEFGLGLSDILLLEVIEDLYMKAEAYPAFTYNAMRMLIRMIKLERDAHNSTSIRDKLLNFAKDRLQKTLAFAKVGQDVNMMAPLLFAAEMYIQLNVGGLRLSRVGEAIVQILYSYMCLDHIPARERYLNTVKILKLIGSSLEVDVPGSLQEAINMLLSEISQESGLDKSTIEIVNNFLKTVLSMTVDETAAAENARSNLSGAAQTEQDRSCPPQVAECPPQVAECPPQVTECPPQVAVNHPVLYGPDGAALSAEEEAFLQSIMSVVDSPWSSPRSSAVTVDDLGQLSD